MKRIFLTFAFALALSMGAFAQVVFVTTNAADGTEQTATRTAGGVNTDFAIYRLPSGANFAPTATGNVTVPNCNPLDVNDEADCQANGVSVFTTDSGGNFIGWGELSYVSSTQINFFYRKTTSNDFNTSTRIFYRQRNPFTGVFSTVGVNNVDPTTIEKRNIHPFLTYATLGGVTGAYLTGTLYGCTSVYDPISAPTCAGYVALKSLTDGAANLREYNGWPTLLQVYISGYNGEKLSPLPQEFLGFKIDGLGGNGTFQAFGSGYGPGVFAANIFYGSNFAGGPVWGGAGHKTFRLGYATLGAGGTTFSFTQGPSTPGGLMTAAMVYF